MAVTLESVKQDVLRLRELGISWGFDDQEIDEIIRRSLREDAVPPLPTRGRQDVWLKKRSKCMTCCSWVLKIALVFAIFIAVNYIIARVYSPYMFYITKQINHLIYPFMRMMRFLILPIHSITPISTMKAIGFWECIIENPFHTAENPSCEHCSDSPKSISRVMTKGSQHFKDAFYGMGYPLIITRVPGYNDVENNFQNLQDLYWLYQKDMEEDLSYVQSKSGKISTLRQLFSSDGYSLGENVIWKTSYGNGMRILRKMYPRPFFISTEGALERSTIILNPKDSNTALVPKGSFSNMWLAQVCGQSVITIKALGPCKEICPSYTVKLKKGEILYSLQDLWDIHVKAVGHELSIVHSSSFF